MVLPNSKIHNGCVRVDDVGYGFGGKHVDWFVAKESNYEFLDSKDSFDKVSVFSGTASNGQKCKILNYN